MGSFAWRVVRFRRKLVLDSLSRAFPVKNSEEIEAVGHRCYRNLGSCFVEMFRVHRLSDDWVRNHITFEGREILESALSRGRGVINVTFHYGNWEFMGAFAARAGLPLLVIAREQTNPYFQEYINRMRQASGMRLVSLSASPKIIARALREGWIVSFLVDQDFHEGGVFVDFLGRPASTPRGPALYAFKTGAPVVLSIMLAQPRNRWLVRFEALSRPETSDREEFIFRMTSAYTERLAEYVRRAPEHWFWPHRRWKTEPPIDVS